MLNHILFAAALFLSPIEAQDATASMSSSSAIPTLVLKDSSKLISNVEVNMVCYNIKHILLTSRLNNFGIGYLWRF